MRVHIHKRSGKPLATIEVPDNATVGQFKEQFYKELHYYPERQRFTMKDIGAPLVDGDLKLKDYGVVDNSIVYFKDLGVQISWRLVFVIEYLGPLCIFPLVFGLASVIHDKPFNPNLTQKLALILGVVHFAKREMETLFIHRFSNLTMPIQRLPINSAHYWILCGLFISFYAFHPLYTPPFQSPIVNLSLAGLMLIFEYCNLRTHIQLRNLRPRGSKAKGIPTGWGFDYVSCANYFWETLAWLTFAILTNCLTSWLFLVVAFCQMTEWAIKKHRNYKRDFKDYPRHRKAIVPFLL